ncbi:GNAT family N-acetyltransferase [Kitasatospora sp. NPDC058406]|uniref:GNAT family N-acetyltransferase n=1 Tax=Kitasatospora sp. NPDC058406 TaxID=3346483 RepID=UPI003669AC4A
MTSTRAPEATTPAITLVPLDVDDAELLYSWRSDPVAAHELGHWPRPLSAVRERIEQDIEDSDHDGFLVVLPDGTPVGSAVLADQDMVDGLACVRFLVAPEQRGHGYGAAALDALVDLAFGELPLHRLEAIPHTTNAPGLATLARAGFVQEGVRRSACFHRGRRHDIAMLALLRPDWEARDRPRSWER